MLYQFFHYRNGRNTQRVLSIGAGVLLLACLLTATAGKAFAFNGTVSWSGWHQVIRSEAPGAPGPTPTADVPNAVDYEVTTPPACGTCLPGVVSTLFLFVREGDDSVNFMTEKPSGPAGWSALTAVPGNGVILGTPSAIQFGNTLYLFAQGTNNGLYMTTYNGSWLGHWVRIMVGSTSISLASSPNAMVYQNALYVFARESDSTMKFYTSSNGTSWTEHIVPGGGLTPNPPTATVAGNTLYLFVQGTNNNIYVQTLNGTTWATLGWQPVTNGQSSISTVNSPGAAFGVDPAGDSAVDLFARQTDGSVQWYVMTTADGIHWSAQGEVPTGGRIVGSPFALSSFAGAPSLFVAGTDSNVWENDQVLDQG